MNRILLVDDEEIANYLHELVIRKLNKFKHINVCSSVQEALDQLQRLADDGEPGPDMLLLDINMPVMNGYDFLDAYTSRNYASRGNTKIVMLSSSLNEKDRVRSLSYSCVADFCSKPLTPEIMTALIDKHLSPASN